MLIIKTVDQWYEVQSTLPTENSLGLVPTMGNLHPGHLALIQHCIDENKQTVLSIFVNPTQFNDPHDLQHYPRTLTEDIALAQTAGVDYLFLPDEDQMYADGSRFSIHENNLSTRLEGAQRPGHFSGMLTIVLKLLLLIQPDRAYFGEKDYQQLQLVRDMVAAFFIRTQVIEVATVRLPNQLPYSSRNNRLSTTQQDQASLFPQLLTNFTDKTHTINTLTEQGFVVEYIEEYQNRRYGAVHFAGVRLIDNVPLSPS